ncbi:MAG TPA: hypothetical protein DCY38_04875, partial [Opitutae bacterium]|nr:hypothetical protein [Opitutae bacterium]
MTKLRRISAILWLTVIAAIHTAATTGYSANEYDVVVYGGTPGGITASISAAREGASVILLEQTRHVGGLTTSG